MSGSDDGARLQPRRVLIGGFSVLAAVAGYLLVRLVVATQGLDRALTIVAMPAFGALGVVGFVVLIAGVVPSERRQASDGE
ncbi:hypothetical protein RYH80_12745 [Halobaculum sp. MBLA0147]|uniref:hypothetical protein n=1 Tax=Halobaculum sp. MBLA0147 TaxID=3079934 RepID=UPI003526478E